MSYRRQSPQPVVEGGTGAQTLTAHGVLLGEGTSAIAATSVGTNGQVLLGTSAADPTFVTPTVGTGLSLTTNATTLQYALSTPVSIANGGTNATSFATTDGTVYYDGTRLVTTATGSSGNVLTSNGAGVAPTYQAPAAGSITITGDTGGGLTGSSFTFTGGTTGLSFGGSGTTETLTFAGITANGGTVSLATDATTSTINVGTGAGVKTSTFGSTNSTSSTTIQSGSGALNITSTNGAQTHNSGTGTLGISTDAAATTVNIGTGAAVKTVTLGSTNSTSSTTINFGGSTGSALSTYVNTTSWTPVLAFGGGSTGITYSTQSGVYARIGSLIMFSCRLVLTNKGSSTGVALITGLNFTPGVGGAVIPVTMRVNFVTFTGELQGYYDSIEIAMEANNAGTVTSITNTNFANNSDIMFSGCFSV